MAEKAGFHYELYRYSPSLPAAIIFCTLFAIGVFIHTFFVVKLRARYFIPFIIGCLCKSLLFSISSLPILTRVLGECIGYAGRAWSHSSPTQLSPFIMQSLLLLVAPAFLAATIYMILGRMIRFLRAEKQSIVPVKWLTKIFVMGDVLSFLVQGSGGGIQAQGTLSSYNTGANIVIGGLILQIVIFGFFVVVAAIFHSRLAKNPTRPSLDPAIPWQKHLYVLYFSSILILVRNLIRVIEYAQGNDGYIVSHEWMLYIFDGILMAAVVVAFSVVHPSKLLRPSNYNPSENLESGLDLTSSENDADRFSQEHVGKR